MGDYFELISSGNGSALFIVVGIVILSILCLIYFAMKRKSASHKPIIQKNKTVAGNTIEAQAANLKAAIREAINEAQFGTPEGAFTAAVWHKDNTVTYEAIEKPIGNPWTFDPSLKLKFGCYLCLEGKDGLVPYDPNVSIQLEEGNTPRDLYDSSHWEENLNEVYIDEAGFWEKVRLLLPYIIVGALILVTMVAIDKIH